MKAIRIHRYGGPEVLQLEEIPSPKCGPHDVRIAVHASSVNPVDYKIRDGLQRSVVWVRRPFTPGMDVSGVLLEVGAKVKHFRVGDEVVSSPSHLRQGTFAEEVVVRADEVAPKPKNLTHEEAASLPLVSMTAWFCLVKSANLKPGQSVLVQAGAGGVGSAAIQLARALGASQVWATCSTRNVELVRELGATPIDYTKEDFRAVARGCDVVLDSLGGDELWKAVKTARRGGHVSCITPQFPELAKTWGPWLALIIFGVWAGWVMAWALISRLVSVRFVTRFAEGSVLRALVELIEAGKLKPVIDRVYPLGEIAQAYAHVEGGRTRGKVVVKVR
ncbi:MAG: NADPH:quinone oxidoreductase [Archangium gephyra]|uniref:NADPH:quinone oxidoreductase n=1 Tax=Archangium gephyra TaxID=48 RepID=A0A2W5SX96_9BACT|nr:MAG: NADPH:quinone oxidoreductase [Archangium gephyra]